MFDPLMASELARLRQQELIDDAAQERLAYQARAMRPQRQTSYLAAAYRQFIRLCPPAGLIIRRTA